MTETTPRVSTQTLAGQYPTVITVDRSAFTLHLSKNLRLIKSYRITVGMAGLDTPAGLYHVQDKQVDGCIRMAIPDVIELYSQTPVGTPVYIT